MAGDEEPMAALADVRQVRRRRRARPAAHEYGPGALDHRRRRGRGVSQRHGRDHDQRCHSQGARRIRWRASGADAREQRDDSGAPQSGERAEIVVTGGRRDAAHGEGRADDLEQPRDVGGGFQERLRDRARTLSGTAQSPLAQGPGEGRLDDPGLRRLGRGRQGWGNPADHGRARRSVVPGDPNRRTDG
jgi:hypothetical protein